MLRQTLPLALLCVVALPGCPPASVPPVFSIADWHLRCDSMMLSCTPPPPRLVTGQNGVDGNTVSCTVVESATDRVVTFRTGSAAGGENFSVAVTGARIPRGGGFAASGCTVTVVDSGNTYQGPCGALAPSATQPCQVEMSFGTDTVSGSTLLHAEILCDHLANPTAPSQLRSLYAGAGSSEPAVLDFFDCRGLSH